MMMGVLTSSQGWLPFVGLTVACWGMYGICLHSGQVQMADPEFGRYKAFFFVGIAYLLTAVLAPAGLLLVRGAEWSFTGPGVAWSLVAGVVGAVGAFSVLLAFGAKGTPAVVMSLVFAGAPIVNALVSVAMHNLWSHVRWPFVVGIAMAAVGAYLVVSFKPAPTPHGVTDQGPEGAGRG
jgi:drug/metabolite transporter (DMT)-like permease